MRPGDITIVGGGWSVGNCLLDCLCGTVIGVNDAAFYLPRVDVVVSMDRLWTEYRWSWLCDRGAETWLRRSAVQNLDTKKAIAEKWLQLFDCDNTADSFSSNAGWLNGPNSGFCALNLAWKLRPRRVFLLGFDMCRDRHGRAYWHPPYPWTAPQGATSNGKYAAWAGMFNKAALAFSGIDCEVYNVSPASAIRAFPKITPAEFAAECKP